MGDVCLMLPKPEELSKEPLYWSDRSVSDNICVDIQCAYDEVVRWKRNLFMVPAWKAGYSFVSELSRLYKAYGESSTMEPIALMAAMTMPALLLQKPFARSKMKDHTTYNA